MKIQPANSDQAPPDQTEPITLDYSIQTKTKKSTKTSALSKAKKKKEGSVIITLVKMARPLNSWMAFRSYYAVIFVTMPQKVISGFLTHMWQAEPTKAKWAILAKAYSELRDKVGKKRAPLPRFLAINAPFIGVVDPDDYLRIRGWDIVERDGQTILRRAARPDGATNGSSMLTTNASVEDVIRNSYYHGYINGGDLGFATLSSGMSLIMATSAQPAGYPSFGSFAIFNTGNNASTNNGAGDTASQGPSGIASEASNSPNGNSNVWETAGLNGIGGTLQQEFAADFDEVDEFGDSAFEPDLDSSSFDPFNNDQFDAFHLSDLTYGNPADWANDDAL